MSKATLEYQLTGDDSDYQHFIMAVHCQEAYALIWEIDQHLRNILKYEVNEKQTRDELAEYIRCMISENGILNHYE